MKHSTQILLFVALGLLATGLLLVVTGLSLSDFDLRNLSTVRSESHTYSVEQTFENIRVEGTECDIRFVPADDGRCTVVCDESTDVVHTVTVNDGTLTVLRTDNRPWYRRIGLFFVEMTVTVYLPDGVYGDLSVTGVSGDLDLSRSPTFSSVKLSSTSGDVSFRNGAVQNTLTVKTVSSDVTLSDLSVGALDARSTSGEIEVSHICTAGQFFLKSTSGDLEMKDCDGGSLTASTTSGEQEFTAVAVNGHWQAESVSGNLDLEDCDAQTLYLKATSGNVSAALRSEKRVICDTVSGTVNVPRSESGGTCEIRTTSGNIRVRIAETAGD